MAPDGNLLKTPVRRKEPLPKGVSDPNKRLENALEVAVNPTLIIPLSDRAICELTDREMLKH